MNEFFNTALSLMYPLALTILIEYSFIQLIVRKKFVLWQVALVNAITNPAINLIFRSMMRNPSLTDTNVWTIISLLEVVVVIIEGILYKFLLKSKWSEAFILSLTANWIAYLVSFML